MREKIKIYYIVLGLFAMFLITGCSENKVETKVLLHTMQ